MIFNINNKIYDILKYESSPYLKLLSFYNESDICYVDKHNDIIKLNVEDMSHEDIENYIAFLDDREFIINDNFKHITLYMGHSQKYSNFNSPFNRIVLSNKWNIKEINNDTIYFGGRSIYICGSFSHNFISNDRQQLNYFFFTSLSDIAFLSSHFKKLGYYSVEDEEVIRFNKYNDKKVFIKHIFDNIIDIQNYISDVSEIPDNYEILYDVKNNILYSSDKYDYSMKYKIINVDIDKLNTHYINNIFNVNIPLFYIDIPFLTEKDDLNYLFKSLYMKSKDTYIHHEYVLSSNIYDMRIRKICCDLNIEYQEHYDLSENSISFFRTYDESSFYDIMSKLSEIINDHVSFITLINYINSKSQNIYDFLNTYNSGMKIRECLQLYKFYNVRSNLTVI